MCFLISQNLKLRLYVFKLSLCNLSDEGKKEKD